MLFIYRTCHRVRCQWSELLTDSSAWWDRPDNHLLLTRVRSMPCRSSLPTI